MSENLTLMEKQRDIKQRLIDELDDLRRQVAQLEKTKNHFQNVETTLWRAGEIRSLILQNDIMGIAYVRNRIFEWANPKVAELFGRPLNQILGAGTRLLYRTDEEYYILGQRKYSALVRNEWFQFENIIARPDGSLRIFRILGKALDPSLPQDGSIWIFEDITDRKKAQEATCRNEAVLNSIFKAAPIGLCVMKDRIFQSANNAWYELFGYNESEIIGHSTRMLYVSEKEYERVGRLLYSNFFQNFRNGAETSLRRKDNIIRRVALTSAPLDLKDDVFKWVVAIEDVTDRQLAQESLKKSEALYRALFDNAGNANILVRDDTTIVLANSEFEKLTGYAKADIEGKMSWTQLVAPDDLNRMLFYHRQRRTDPASVPRKYEFRAIDQAGQIKDIDLYIEMIPSSGESIASLHDITAHKRAEKMEALGQLAGGVAHDLNNILGTLSGFSELLTLTLPEGQKARGHAEKILQSTKKATAVVQDLLTLARRGVMAADVVNLNSIVADFLKTPLFDKMKDQPGITFKIDCQGDLPDIKGSCLHLEKTLMNLILNAAESLPHDGDVIIRTRDILVEETLRGYEEIQPGRYSVLSVTDSGTGIPEEHLGKIFEPFYTKKTMGKSGTGLGLAIVWGTVKDHNGYIDIRTKPGQGTTFALYFPTTREKRIAPHRAVPIEQYRGQGESVLVIDDITEQREVACAMLQQLGYQVAAAESGEKALEYIRHHQTDLLFLDMVMDPEMDGLETYEKILSIRPHQKAIVVSGFSETDRVRKAQALGAGAYVRKPYTMEDIGAAIRKELTRQHIYLRR